MAAPAWSTLAVVPIEKVDAELRSRWLGAGLGNKPVTRTQTMSIVAVCETPAHAELAHQAVSVASGVHGARTIVVTADDASDPSITAEISLHSRSGKGSTESAPGIPGGEEVRLHAHGAARAWIPDTVGKLLAPDVPVYVWWVGDLPDDDALFDQLAPLSQLAIFNSSDMDLRDLDALARIATRGADRYALGDFDWHRLRTWQELLARFFDDHACAAELSSLTQVAISFRPRNDRSRTSDPISNQAALCAGWLAHVLHWKLDAWRPLGKGAPTVAMKTAAGSTVEISFPLIEREDVAVGAIVAIELQSAKGSFRVALDDHDPLLICRTGERHGVEAKPAQAKPAQAKTAQAGDAASAIPVQSVRIHAWETPRILAHVLEHPVRDPLFEASLRAAASIVAEVAPTAPKASVTEPTSKVPS